MGDGGWGGAAHFSSDFFALRALWSPPSSPAPCAPGPRGDSGTCRAGRVGPGARGAGTQGECRARGEGARARRRGRGGEHGVWTARQREGETERAAHAKRIARRRGCRAFVPTAHRTATKPTTWARGLHTFIMAGGRPVCARRVAVWKLGRAGPRCAGRPAGERQAGRQETFDINRSTPSGFVRARRASLCPRVRKSRGTLRHGRRFICIHALCTMQRRANKRQKQWLSSLSHRKRQGVRLHACLKGRLALTSTLRVPQWSGALVLAPLLAVGQRCAVITVGSRCAPSAVSWSCLGGAERTCLRQSLFR